MSKANGSMPAAPSAVSNSDGIVEDSNVHGYGYGLTKREAFAMNAPPMPDWYDSNETSASKRFFAWPAFYADSLLMELDK